MKPPLYMINMEILSPSIMGMRINLGYFTDEIPETLKNAFIAIEDARFNVHNGIDIKRIFGSIIHNPAISVQGPVL